MNEVRAEETPVSDDRTAEKGWVSAEAADDAVVSPAIDFLIVFGCTFAAALSLVVIL